MAFLSSYWILETYFSWSSSSLCLLQIECSLSKATVSDYLVIYCGIARISYLSSLIAFSALSLSSLIALSLSYLIAAMTLCSKSSIRYLREVKLLSIYSVLDVNTPMSYSNSYDTLPPSVLIMSLLTSPNTLLIENDLALLFTN